MNERILFVDDDPNLLAACERNFRRQFPLDTAAGGEAGLARLAERGPYAVVISDRQMPGMDGIQFLTTVKERAPDTVRIMLTGNVDLEAAVRVVNEGNIFRFLLKPCPLETLAKAVEDARAQYRLVIAERELLNKTLNGSIKLLTDILASMDAHSFGHADELRPLLADLGDHLATDTAWEIQLAAMLAPIGLVTLPPETLLRFRDRQPLSRVEEQLVTTAPEIAARLLGNIPRLDGVAKIVRYQQKKFDGTGFPPDSCKCDAIPRGARLLKILADFLQLRTHGYNRRDAFEEMQQRLGWYDPHLLAMIREHFCGPEVHPTETVPTLSVTVKDLTVGMRLHSDVVTKEGTLVLKAGHLINEMTLEKIQNFESVSGIQDPIFVECPETAAAT
ncbi:MAG TPA: HD domain-containing phosphohydrolase [Dongiaceae bacterium]|nr:HD domain-containing phosphohydrolase [Dongiaceae bacterium]